VSTFGRDSDRQAEIRRRYQRQLTEKRARLDEGLRYSIYTLRDMTVADDMARALVLACLLELYRDRRERPASTE
jgi:hypothetical protein